MEVSIVCNSLYASLKLIESLPTCEVPSLLNVGFIYQEEDVVGNNC
jgi:hypothetical protein